MEFVGICSTLLHAGFIAYGHWQDTHSDFAVKYTDVDYWVMSDAAELMRKGLSPYERPTFRYSPLLAAILVPNRFFGEIFGKCLFSLFDIVSAYIIFTLLRRQGVQGAAWYTAILWACNPMVITVSTRGNAESIVCTLCLLFIWLLSIRKRTMSAAVLGLAMHVKLFPVLFIPSILVFMGLFPDAGKHSSGLQCGSIPGTPIKPHSPSDKKFIDLRWKHLQYLIVAFGTFAICTIATFALYGRKGIHESLLYHLTRRDHRHNFSPYWLMYYHDATLKMPQWFTSLLPFVPQAALSLTVAWFYGRRDFCFSCFLQTFMFVSLNKYFLWYICLLPVCLPSLKAGKWDEWASIGGAWIGCQALFLALAYRLEFLGEPVFEQVWLSSLLFLVCNVWIARSLLLMHAKSKMPIKAP